jgi:hypothetical protein
MLLKGDEGAAKFGGGVAENGDFRQGLRHDTRELCQFYRRNFDATCLWLSQPVGLAVVE